MFFLFTSLKAPWGQWLHAPGEPSTGRAHRCSVRRCSAIICETRMSKWIYKITTTFSLFPLLTLPCPDSFSVHAFKNKLCPAFEETGKKRGVSYLYSYCLLSRWWRGKETILKGNLWNNFIKKKTTVISWIAYWLKILFKKMFRIILEPEWSFGLIQYNQAEQRFTNQLSQGPHFSKEELRATVTKICTGLPYSSWCNK